MGKEAERLVAASSPRRGGGNGVSGASLLSAGSRFTGRGAADAVNQPATATAAAKSLQASMLGDLQSLQNMAPGGDDGLNMLAA